MRRAICIELVGAQLFDEDVEPQVIRERSDGTYYSRDGYEFAIYYQVDENSEIRNLIKFKEDFLELSKKGAYTSHLIFEPGKEYTSNYHTPYGVMTVNVCTQSLKISHVGSTVDIHIVYDMTLNDDCVAKCELKINIKDKENER